jgi:DNA-binding transcriptional regulator YdaS (Cro superfamily)
MMPDQLKTQLKQNGFRLIDLAERMGVNKATVTRWSSGRVPAERVLDVARITGIPKEELRPDLYRVEERA